MAQVSFAGSFAASISNYTTATQLLQQTVERLSSGTRLIPPSYDIAALSTSALLSSQISGQRSAIQNAAQAGSVLEIAGGALDQIGDLLNSMKALATTGTNGALTPAERGLLQAQFDGFKDEIDRIAEDTRFGDQPLLDGTFDTSFSLGDSSIDVTIGNSDSATLLGGATPTLDDVTNAGAASTTISTALDALGVIRANVGALQEQFDFAGGALSNSTSNLIGARAVLTDTDIAEESTRYAMLAVQQQVSAAMLAQAQKLNSSLLGLMRSAA